ncbi:Fructosamine-3-kinase [Pseudooceanicola antarcticus]|uniref:Aminoglycoside phosphotransferase n=1 Tax=Pseudooceanicola antarcticus TaxID=1247613 RepID=A0A285ITI1_9RHOB|nr:fructosamine kinase family protein [Pseudooceanicola antarcticus]PJE32027.1 aminoglycoside phosphotransferase [Pseudooceanicola antarcticus]SNY51298.1 Fructosamine-3-kinase [Pseudooceanicola antarcticus]
MGLGALSDRIGAPLAEARALHGGDLSEVFAVTFADGRRRVAKLSALAEQEGRMLQALAQAGAPVPQVHEARPGLLLLEALEETRPGPQGWTRLGEALRLLHAAPAPLSRYGWHEDYAFGALPIPAGADPAATDWPDFWARARLLPASRPLPGDLRQRIEALCTRLPQFLPARPGPALLHGDLWTGNLLFGPGDRVHLIDPACYLGDPEVDLAMLHLFGRPGPGFAEAYGALAPGWEERRAIYQLWPALVHLRLFGMGYRGMVEDLLDRLG